MSLSKKLSGLKDKNIREIFRGSSIAFAYRIIGAFLNYYLIFIIPRRFGVESLGVFNLCTTIIAVLALAGTLGFNTSVLRFIAQFHSQKSYNNIALLYKGILKLIIPLGITISVLLFFFADLVAYYIFSDACYTQPLRIVACTLPFSVVLNIHIEFIRGLKKIQYSEYLRNLNQPLINTIVIFMAGFSLFRTFNFNELPLIGYGLGIILSFLFSTTVILNFLKKHPSETNKNTNDTFSMKEQINVALPMIITSFAQMFQARLGVIILGIMSTTISVAAYGTAAKLAILTTFVQMAVNTISATKFSELFWDHKIKELNKVVGFSTGMVFMVSFPVVLVLIIFPEFLLGLVDKEITSGKTALIILAIAQFVSAASGSVGVFLNMTGNQVILRNLVSMAIIINIALNIILVPMFNMTGTAVAHLISVSFWNIGGAIYIYRKYKIKSFYLPLIGKLIP